MNNVIFSRRPTITIELPLAKNEQILRPEQVIVKIGHSNQDFGAFCYALRSERKAIGHPCGVVLNSFIKQRPRQIRQIVKAISALITDAGLRNHTVISYANYLKTFIDWTDKNGMHDCLAGGEGTRRAFRAWAEHTQERYRRQEIGEHSHNRCIAINVLLEAATGLEGLSHGVRKLRKPWNPNGSTEPIAPRDFAHAIALNQSLFDGLCDLVLKQLPFPYRLALPATLGWTENILWVFPLHVWCRPPHEWGKEREQSNTPCWAYDYEAGGLARPEDIVHRYAVQPLPSGQLKVARHAVSLAKKQVSAANLDGQFWVRRRLAMLAQHAFLMLFICQTGANESVVREIETDGEFDLTTVNQRFRSIKFRAGGKPISLDVPVSFLPNLRRFMELRRYLLNGTSFPYLFFSLGITSATLPARRISNEPLKSLYSNILRNIDPQLPRLSTRKLRASVADWYQRHHDASITAKVLQNSEQTSLKHYDAGSLVDHREELSLFLQSVATAARQQPIVSLAKAADAPRLEEGGRCNNFGRPEALASEVPVTPDCRDSQGCLFCAQRVLVACEDDARKVASAAFLMEQVILGPKHEETLRPLIAKCDEDLRSIAAFENCFGMVERVREDVFERGNLTPFFADKYQLFLELGVIN